MITGSTYEEDETLLLEFTSCSAEQLEKKTPSKRILSIIAPRKMEHVGSLKRHIEKRGLKALHWSSTHMGTSTSDNTRKHVHEDPDVLLIDTVGILCLLKKGLRIVYM